MPSTMPQAARSALPVRAEKCAKAHLGNPEVVCEWRRRVGRAVEQARLSRKWSTDELAGKVGRDARQVGRWQTGDERPQFDVLFGVDDTRFRNALVVALAELGSGVEIRTVIGVPACVNF